MSDLTAQAVTMALWTKDAEGKNNYTDLGCTAVAGNENPGCDPLARANSPVTSLSTCWSCCA